MADIVTMHRNYDITKALISGERVQNAIRCIHLRDHKIPEEIKVSFEMILANILSRCDAMYGHPFNLSSSYEEFRTGPITWEGEITKSYPGEPCTPLYKLHYEFIKKALWDDHDPVDPNHLQDCYGLKMTCTFENCLTQYPTDLKGE